MLIQLPGRKDIGLDENIWVGDKNSVSLGRFFIRL